MLKATRFRAVLLGLTAAFAVVGPAFAEVQNVKVGGQVNVRGFVRKSMLLSDDVHSRATAGAGGVDSATADFGNSGDSFVQQLSAIDVSGDLTENVKVQTRLTNERVWTALNSNAVAGTDADANQVQLSLANVTLKELFYSPLTVILGRQKLWYGRGFIVGSRLLASDFDQADALAADEFTDQTGFDAVRAIVDLSGNAPMNMPVTLDAVYAKINERGIGATTNGGPTVVSGADDLNLWGVNVGTKFDQGEAEAYFFKKVDNGSSANNGNLDNNPQANTLGIRGSVAPTEASSVWGEFAHQWGNRLVTATTFDAEGAAGDGYTAWAANLGGDLSIKDAPWSPKVGAEWIWYSGDDGNASAIGAWDPMFRGSFTTALREFQGAGFYLPAQSGATIGGTFNTITNSATNQHQFAGHATVWPIEDLSVDNRLTWFRTDNGIVPVAGAKRQHYLGFEWDVQANYNYTDDVQFGVIYALFAPGNVFRTPYDDNAQELVSSVNVKF